MKSIFRCAIPCCIVFILGFSTTASAQYVFNLDAFPTGAGSTSILYADFNGDHRLDLAVTNLSANTVSILLARPDGTFAPKIDFATGISPAAIASGDFNGDGKIDLAIVNQATDTVSVLLGNGDGTFQSHSDYAVGIGPVGIVAGVFTTSGKVDLAVANYNDSTVSILLGNGDGTFQPQTTEPVAISPQSLSGGDFNNDGKLDLITVSANPGTVSVLLSNGDGTVKRVDSPAGPSGPDFVTVATGDLNADKKLDAVVSSRDSSQLYLLLGNGDGAFQSPVPLLNLQYAPVANVIVGDFNNDGRLDLAAGDGNVIVLLGRGDGKFGSPIISPMGVSPTENSAAFVALDVNRDGWLDLVVANGVASVSTVIGLGNGKFDSPSTSSLPSDSYGVNSSVAADFNGDGKLDVAVAEEGFPNGQLAVKLGKGDGTFGKPIVSPLGVEAINNSDLLRSGDFNGDGKVDILIADDYLAGFSVSLNNGDGTFSAGVNTPLAYTVYHLAVGDFNGDGKSDVAVSSNATGTGQVNIYLGNGDGTFTSGAQYEVPFYSRLTIADVNRDGRPDLVAASFGEDLLVFLGNGDGTFQKPILGPETTFSSNIVIADFDRDGKPDIAVGTYSGFGFLAGNGDGTFANPIYSDNSLQSCCQLAVGEFNGDGIPDLLNGGGAGTFTIMSGNGDGTFGPPIPYGASGTVYSGDIAVGDFNSDNVDDVVMSYQNTVSGSNDLGIYISTPTVNLSRSEINFGSESVGKTSPPQKIKLSNIGNSALLFSNIIASGDFLESDNCGKTRRIGSSCTINVSFKPKAKGLRTGRLTIKDNAKSSPQEVRLKGIGD